MTIYYEASLTLDPAQVIHLTRAASEDARFDVFDEPIIVTPEAAGVTIVAPALPGLAEARAVLHAVDKVVNPAGLSAVEPWREVIVDAALMERHMQAGGLVASTTQGVRR